MSPVKRRQKLPSAPAEGFHFDEAKHLYFFDGKPMTGCTTILGVLAKPALIPWAAKMAVEYIKEHGREIDLDDLQGWVVSPALLDEARTAHAKKRDNAADAGTQLHALVEAWVLECIDKKDGLPHADSDKPELGAFIQWAVKENIRFIATEQRLYSKELWVAGTCDLIFEKDGKRYIADVKTFKKIWDKVPLIQCAGYSIMYEEMEHDAFQGTKQQPIDGYCIICLPKERTFDEGQDILWSHDVEGDKEAFISCVQLYRYLNN